MKFSFKVQQYQTDAVEAVARRLSSLTDYANQITGLCGICFFGDVSP